MASNDDTSAIKTALDAAGEALGLRADHSGRRGDHHDDRPGRDTDPMGGDHPDSEACVVAFLRVV